MIDESIRLKLIQFLTVGKAKELLSQATNQINKEEKENTKNIGYFGHSLSNFQLNKLDKHFGKSKEAQSVGQYIKKLATDRGIYEVNDETFGIASITKPFWSKLVNDKHPKHDKDKLIRLSLFLKLTLFETMKLLNKAGFTLSKENSKDNIIIFCIEEGIYDLYDVEDLLEERGQRTLFSNFRTINTKK